MGIFKTKKSEDEVKRTLQAENKLLLERLNEAEVINLKADRKHFDEINSLKNRLIIIANDFQTLKSNHLVQINELKNDFNEQKEEFKTEVESIARDQVEAAEEAARESIKLEVKTIREEAEQEIKSAQKEAKSSIAKAEADANKAIEDFKVSTKKDIEVLRLKNEELNNVNGMLAGENANFKSVVEILENQIADYITLTKSLVNKVPDMNVKLESTMVPQLPAVSKPQGGEKKG